MVQEEKKFGSDRCLNNMTTKMLKAESRNNKYRFIEAYK